jgi:hypothetical protein
LRIVPSKIYLGSGNIASFLISQKVLPRKSKVSHFFGKLIVTQGEFRDISFDTILIGDIYMLETLAGRTDKDGGKIGASMAIFFKTAEQQVPGLPAVDQNSTEEELFGGGET